VNLPAWSGGRLLQFHTPRFYEANGDQNDQLFSFYVHGESEVFWSYDVGDDDDGDAGGDGGGYEAYCGVFEQVWWLSSSLSAYNDLLTRTDHPTSHKSDQKGPFDAATIIAL
jgi:hypothetical protein